MTKSDYKYEILSKQQIIIIEDLDKGNMSVTNDIENVVEQIFMKEKLSSNDNYKIIYKDSRGKWDGYNQNTGRFIFLKVTDKQQAIDFASKIDIKQWLS